MSTYKQNLEEFNTYLKHSLPYSNDEDRKLYLKRMQDLIDFILLPSFPLAQADGLDLSADQLEAFIEHILISTKQLRSKIYMEQYSSEEWIQFLDKSLKYELIAMILAVIILPSIDYLSSLNIINSWTGFLGSSIVLVIALSIFIITFAEKKDYENTFAHRNILMHEFEKFDDVLDHEDFKFKFSKYFAEDLKSSLSISRTLNL